MSGDIATSRPELMGQVDRQTLVRALRVMFPHAAIPDGPYGRTVDGLLADAAATPYLAGVLAQGLRDLDSLAGGTFAALGDDMAYDVLTGVQETPFFAALRTRAINTLYNDPEVWEILGYEGPSFEKGGYVDRGFADLDWLPEPPL